MLTSTPCAVLAADLRHNCPRHRRANRRGNQEVGVEDSLQQLRPRPDDLLHDLDRAAENAGQSSTDCMASPMFARTLRFNRPRCLAQRSESVRHASLRRALRSSFQAQVALPGPPLLGGEPMGDRVVLGVAEGEVHDRGARPARALDLAGTTPWYGRSINTLGNSPTSATSASPAATSPSASTSRPSWETCWAVQCGGMAFGATTRPLGSWRSSPRGCWPTADALVRPSHDSDRPRNPSPRSAPQRPAFSPRAARATRSKNQRTPGSSPVVALRNKDKPIAGRSKGGSRRSRS